jgi:His/Glu/Gln/Arg/opine family amino acid ABC transporter permease subunit
MFDYLRKGIYQTFILDNNYLYFVRGIRVTLLVTALALILGLALGVLVAVIRSAHDQQRGDRRKNPVLGVLNVVAKLYVTVIRGTPTMVQLLIMWFVVMSARATDANMIRCAVLTFGINSGAYVAEIIRGGLMSLDSGQSEAGRSLGLNYFQTMRFIVVPQAFKAILPALGNEFIVLLKDTSLITVIGGKELLYAARGVMNRTYEQMFPLLGTAGIYLVLVIIFSWLLGKLERRLRQSDRR